MRERRQLPQLVVRLLKVLDSLDSKVLTSFMWYPALIAYGVRRIHPRAFAHVIHDTVPMMEFIRYELSLERFRRAKLYLIRKAYDDADLLIGNSLGVKNDFLEFGMRPERVFMIYNPLNREMIIRAAEEDYAGAVDDVAAERRGAELTEELQAQIDKRYCATGDFSGEARLPKGLGRASESIQKSTGRDAGETHDYR